MHKISYFKMKIKGKYSVKFILPAISGILLFLAFPPVKMFYLVFIALVPLFFSIKINKKSGFLKGLITGFVFYYLHLYWISTLGVDGITKILLSAGVIFTVLYLSMYSAVTSYFLSRTNNSFTFFITAICMWTAGDFIRSLTNQVSFPWGSLAYSLARYPLMIQIASIFGMYSIVFWIISVNVLIFLSSQKRKWALILLPFFILIPILYGAYSLREAKEKEKYDETQIKIALIQPNIQQDIKGGDSPELRYLRRKILLEHTSEVVALHSPDIVVWPETSWPWPMKYIFQEFYPASKELIDSVLIWNTNLFVSCVDIKRWHGELRPTNSIFLINSNGEIQSRQDKIYLVPFGEHLPFDNVIPFLTKIDIGQSTYIQGSEFVLHEISGVKIGVGICFEAIYPKFFALLNDKGAQVLLNTTDDQWFGNTPGPFQHADMAILRAVENRRFLLRCANNGITFVVDPYGNVIEEIKRNKKGVIIYDIVLYNGESFYRKIFKDLFSWTTVFISFVICLIPFVKKIKKFKRGKTDV